jgi:hypothetical protein
MKQLSTARRAKSWLKTVRGGRVTLGELTDALGERGFGFLLLALTLPNVLLIPSVPVLPLIPGIPAMLLCMQMVLGRRSPWLPGWAARLSVRKEHAEKCIRFAGWMSSAARPRLPWLTGPVGERVLGAVALLLTAVLCVPIPGVNLLTAMGTLALALGMAEGDGLLAAAGSVTGICGAALTVWVLAALAA